jgi:UDP-4-amino-4,6-dideoxy-N-acetyl-beta-L-altrosamine transaminase
MSEAQAFLPYGRQQIDEADVEAMVDVLRSDYLTQGPAVERFEGAVKSFCGAGHGVAVASGTAALHTALKVLGVGHGDRVWTSPITFVASANAARYCGASVDFVDVDPGTVNLSPQALGVKLQAAEQSGTLPKVVIPVHFGGQSCAMDEIHALAGRYGFRIVEDAAHALGGDYLGERVGNCRWSDIVTHSFHPVKIVTTGEGGMLTTNDAELAWKAATFRTHGITRDPARMVGESDGPWYYQQLELGYHYRMTDLQAALGTSQMGKLEAFVARRREIAALYDEALRGLPMEPLARDPRARSAWHLYVVRLNSAVRRPVFEALRAAGIGVNVHYIPAHLQPDYRRLGFESGMFPEAERYYGECLTLPMFPGMSDADVERVRTVLAKAFAQSSCSL